MDFSEIVATISDISIFLPGFFVIIRRNLKGVNRLLSAIILVTLVRNLVSMVIEYLREYLSLDLNTLFVYNLHNILLFGLIAFLYYTQIKGKIWKWFIISAFLVFFCLALVDYQTILYWNIDRFNKFSYPVSGFFSIIFLLLYFYQLLKELSVPNLSDYPLFWFSTGGLIYFSGTFFMYLLIQNFTKNPEIGRLYWPIDAILSIAFNILAAIAFWKMPSTT
jgi:hypothetical protein